MTNKSLKICFCRKLLKKAFPAPKWADRSPTRLWKYIFGSLGYKTPCHGSKNCYLICLVFVLVSGLGLSTQTNQHTDKYKSKYRKHLVTTSRYADLTSHSKSMRKSTLRRSLSRLVAPRLTFSKKIVYWRMCTEFQVLSFLFCQPAPNILAN